MFKSLMVLVLMLCPIFLRIAGATDENSHTVNVSSQHTFVPKDGFVPDGATAKSIAEAVAIPIYGEQAIKRQRPYVARLSNDVWTVTGSLPTGEVGGVFLVEVSKDDARVIRVTHGK